MSTQVEQRVLEMRFDNSQFEQNAGQTITTLEKLENSLKLDGAAKGLNGLQTSVDAVSFAKMQASIDKIAGHFSIWGRAVDAVIGGIGNKVGSFFSNIFNQLTVAPVTDGFKEYEEKMGSVQTIMASSKADLATVNRYLAELNEYSDKTIYSFKDMTSSIGKFTNAGVDLDTAVKAIQGISNEAAISGANANEASRAMYNFAQALSTGSVKLIDWKSIENANMATVEFKEQLLETAVACGTVKKNSDGMYEVLTTGGTGGKMKEAISATAKFNDSLSYQWMTADVLTKTLTKYADETTDLGKRATAAATEVKTWSQLFDTLKEAVGSGWSETFEIIFGDFEQAKELWTGINNAASDIIDKFSSARNNLLREAFGTRSNIFSGDTIRELIGETDFLKVLRGSLKDAGVETKSLAEANGKLENALAALAKNSGVDIDSLIKKSGSLFDTLDNGWLSAEMLRDGLKEITDASGSAGSSLEELEKIADQVISGKFGNGDKRVKALTEAGYDYASVQSIVNHKLLGTEINLDALSDAQLKSKGYTEEQIKVLRALQKQAEDTGTPLGLLIDKMTRPTARTLILETIANLYKTLVNLAKPVGDAMEVVFGKFDSERLYQNIKAVHDYTERMATSALAFSEPIKSVIVFILKMAKTVFGLFGKVAGFAISSAVTIISSLSKVFLFLSEDVTNVFEKIGSVLGFFGRMFKAELFAPIGKSSKNIIKVVGNKLYWGFLKARVAVLRFSKTFEPLAKVLKTFIKQSEPIIRSKLADAFLRLKDIVLNLKNSFVNSVGRFANVGAIFTKIKSSVEPLTEKIKEIIGSGLTFKEKLIGIKNALLEFLKGIGDTIVQNSALQKVFDFLKEKVEKLKGAFKSFTGIDLGSAFGTIRQKFSEIVDTFKDKPIFTDFFGTIREEIEKIKSGGVLDWLKGKFDEIKEGITSFFTNTDGSELSILDRLVAITEPIKTFMSTQFDNGGVFAHNVTSAFSVLIQSIKNALDQFDPSTLKTITIVSLGIYLISRSMQTLASLTTIVKTAGKSASGIVKVINSLNAVLIQKKKELNAKAFLMLALSVLSVAAALYLLSKVPAEQIGAASFALLVALAGIALVLKAMAALKAAEASKLAAETADAAAKGVDALRKSLGETANSFAAAANEVAKGIKFAAMIISFAIAIGIVAYTVIQLSKFTWDEIQNGLLVAAGIAFGLYTVAKSMSSLRGMTIGDALSFIAIAAAIRIIAGSLTELTTFVKDADPVSFALAAVAIGTIAISLGVMAGIMQKIAKDGKNLAAAGLTILLMAVAIRALVGPLTILGALPRDQLIQGGLALAGIAAGLGVLLFVTSKLSGDAKTVAVVLGAFSTAILLIAGALFVLAKFTDGTALISTVIAMVTVIGVFTVAMIALAQFAPQIAILGTGLQSMGIGLLACAAAVLVFVAAIALLGVSLPLIGQGMVRFAHIIVENAPILLQGITILAMMIATALVTIAPVIASAGIRAVVTIVSLIFAALASIGPERLKAFLVMAAKGIWAGIKWLLGVLAGFFSGLFKALGGLLEIGFSSFFNGLDEVVAKGVKAFGEMLPLGLGDGLVNWANGVLDGVEAFKEDMKKKTAEISEESEDFVSAEDFDKSSEAKVGFDNTRQAVADGTAGVVEEYQAGAAEIEAVSAEGYTLPFDLTEEIGQAGDNNILAMGGFTDSMNGGITDMISNITTFGEGEGIDISSLVGDNFDMSESLGIVTQNNVQSIDDSAAQTVEAENRFYDTVHEASNMDSGKLYSEYSSDGRHSIGGWKDGFESGVEDAKKSVSKTFTAVIDKAHAVLQIGSPSKVFTDMGRYSAEGYGDGIRAAGPAAQREVTTLMKGALDRIAQQNSKWTAAAKTSANNYANGLKSATAKANARSAGNAIANAAYSGLISVKATEWYKVGANVSQGFINGINSKKKSVKDAAGSLASAAVNKLKNVPDIQSPSRVTMEIGRYFGEGFAIGISNMTRVAEISAENLAEDTITAMREALGRAKDLVATDIEMDPVIKPVLDLSDIRNGATLMNGLLDTSTTVQVGGFANRSDSMTEMIELLRLDMRNRRLAAAGAGGNTYNITVNAPTGNARDIAREIEKIIVRR